MLANPISSTYFFDSEMQLVELSLKKVNIHWSNTITKLNKVVLSVHLLVNHFLPFSLNRREKRRGDKTGGGERKGEERRGEEGRWRAKLTYIPQTER